ncbi:MAG: hypothetical protein U0234_26610 [Sandaracinus sp.]
MQMWAENHPRAAGVLLITMSFVLAGVNVATLAYASRYYPMLFPMAGACAVIGSIQAVTGIRARRDAPMAERAPALVASFVGLGLGFLANYLWTGSAL